MQKFNNIYVFIYGTLKKNCEANFLLSESEFIEEGITLEKFKMVETSFPAVYFDSQGYYVKGEIWKIDYYTLIHLDYYEDYPRFYKRKEIKVKGLKTGNIYKCQIYYIPEYLKTLFDREVYPKKGILEWNCKKKEGGKSW